MRMAKVYLTGAIDRNDIEQAEARFNAATERLQGKNHSVVSSLRIVRSQFCSGKAALKHLIPLLLGCEAIFLLDNWQQSDRARIEESIARFSGMTILREQDLN